MVYIKKGYNPWNKGKKLSEETKAKMKGRTPWNKDKKGTQVAWNKGLKTPIETRTKMRLKKLRKGYINKAGYRMLSMFGKHILEHDYVWLRGNQLHRLPMGCEVHHIDGNGLNNRINNLQLLDKSTHAKLHWAFEKKNNIRRNY